MTIRDITGREILPGSYIAYAVRRHNAPHLKIARVLAIRHSIARTDIKTYLSVQSVERNVDGTFRRTFPKSCLKSLRRIVVLSEIPDGIKNLFE